MLLSQILEEAKIISKSEYVINNEQEFESLGLLASEVDYKLCTFLDDEKFIDNVPDNVAMLITKAELAEKMLERNFGICIVESPRLLFFYLHNYLSQDERYIRTKNRTRIGDNCNISQHSIIAEHNVVIGNNVVIEEFAVIRENTVIGDNTIIRSGVKLGGEGFEFKRTSGAIESVKHLGGVIIGNNVEIQYNSCIDKAVYPWDNTIIGDNSKIDNLVHVGHAVKIADCVMVVAQSGIGGRTEIDSDCWIGFSATISNGLHIGRAARTNIGSVVTKNVVAEESVTGNFAIRHDKFIRNLKRIVQE